MKKIVYLIIAFGCAVTAACSCNEQQPQELPPPEETTDIYYKFIASTMKGVWKVGDQIYVRGNLGYDAQTITLTAADISEDGKTAVSKLDEKLMKSPAEPDGLYAAWPAGAINPYNGIANAKNTFKDSEALLTAAYLSGDTFQFVDVSGALCFSVDGDYDQWAICANDRNGICITRFECEYSSQNKIFKYKQNDGYPYRYGNLESGKAKIWFPGDFSFSNGFTIYLGKGDNWTATYTASSAQNLTAGQTKDLGNITASITPYSGLAPKMPRQGEMTKYTVSFEELSGVRISEDGKFLWGLGDEGDLAQLSLTGKVLSQYHCGGDAEDVTINTDTHDLLLGMEPDGIGIIKAPDFNTRYSTVMNLSACANYGNSGIEGIAYYKDGMVFAGAQSNSHLFLCDINSKTILWEKKLYDKNRVSEIAGLCYDPKSGWLWIVDSEAKKVFVFAIDHSVTGGTWSVSMDYIGAYPVAGSNPESVCIDRINNCMWVGDDYGSTSYLYRYEFTGLDEFDLAGGE